MPLRRILSLVSFGTLLAWSGVIALVLLFRPDDLMIWGVLLFYVFLFLATVGTCTVLGTVIRVRIRRASVPVRQLMRSFRQAIFFGLLVIVALVLSHTELLSSWSLLLLIVGLGFVELFFVTSRSRAT